MKAFILIFLSLVTFPFIGLGLLEIKNTIIVQQSTIRTEGEVIGNLRQTGAGGTVYNPTVKFKHANGKFILFTDQVGSYPPAYKIGSKVAIKYPAQNPHDAIIYSFIRVWLVPLIFLFAGLLPWIILSIFYFKYWRS